MNQKNRNAVVALLAEYEKAVIELQNAIDGISIADLKAIVDNLTGNPDCKSIQTILTHVISSGYSYCVYIRKLKSRSTERPEKTHRSTISEYKKDLDDVLKFTYDTFSNIYDYELEEFDNSKKMMTSWGQLYDIEQLMEHAIVHVLRHRRQIEKYKKAALINNI